MARLWCFALLAALACALVSVTADLHRLPMIGELQVPPIASSLSSAAQNVADEISRGVSSAATWLDRIGDWEQKALSKIANFFLAPPSLFKGSPGATEPIAVPEPPIMHHDLPRAQLAAIFSDVLDKFDKASVMASNCLDELEMRLVMLKDILSFRIQREVCDTRSAHFEGLCQLLGKSKEAALDTLFQKFRLQPFGLARGRSLRCKQDVPVLRQTFKLAHRIRDSLSRSNFRGPVLDLANQHLSEICQSSRCPKIQAVCNLRSSHKEVVNSILVSVLGARRHEMTTLRRVSPCRRAMLFKGMTTALGQVEMEIHVYSIQMEQPLNRLRVHKHYAAEETGAIQSVLRGILQRAALRSAADKAGLTLPSSLNTDIPRSSAVTPLLVRHAAVFTSAKQAANESDEEVIAQPSSSGSNNGHSAAAAVM